MPPRAASSRVNVLPMHRYAFVQELMRLGYATERDALATFKKLTGSTDGVRRAVLRAALLCAACARARVLEA